MIACGLEKIDEPDDDYEPKELTLKEVQFLFSFRELALIRKFFDFAEGELRMAEALYPREFHHRHFRDWYPGWKEGDPDIVINVNMSLYPPEES